jgi:hypothetical protein
MITPVTSFTVLLVVQALHLLHHRFARRHISFVEGLAAGVLCVPLTLPIPGWCYVVTHLGFAAVQVIGSTSIKRFSPNWDASG